MLIGLMIGFGILLIGIAAHELRVIEKYEERERDLTLGDYE